MVGSQNNLYLASASCEGRQTVVPTYRVWLIAILSEAQEPGYDGNLDIHTWGSLPDVFVHVASWPRRGSRSLDPWLVTLPETNYACWIGAWRDFSLLPSPPHRASDARYRSCHAALSLFMLLFSLQPVDRIPVCYASGHHISILRQDRSVSANLSDRFTRAQVRCIYVIVLVGSAPSESLFHDLELFGFSDLNLTLQTCHIALD